MSYKRNTEGIGPIKKVVRSIVKTTRKQNIELSIANPILLRSRNPPYKFEKPALSDIFYTEGFDGCAYMIEVKPFQQTFLLMKSDVGRTYLWTRKT